jgi:DNA-directed RNA polymerase subunit omega
MARVTVEDCLDQGIGRFDLILVASKRARQIANGADPLITANGDKPTVIALREIADGLIGADFLEEKDTTTDDALAAFLEEEASLAKEASPAS